MDIVLVAWFLFGVAAVSALGLSRVPLWARVGVLVVLVGIVGLQGFFALLAGGQSVMPFDAAMIGMAAASAWFSRWDFSGGWRSVFLPAAKDVTMVEWIAGGVLLASILVGNWLAVAVFLVLAVAGWARDRRGVAVSTAE